MLGLSLPALAAGYRDRIAAAEELVRKGDAAEAVAAYQALQVDYPGEAAVLFGLATAQYRRGEALIGEQPQEAVTAFQEARTAFDRVLEGEPTRFSAHAAFNRANCIAKVAAAIPPDQHQQAVAGYRAAAAAFEAVLKAYPDYEAARRNLDHVRYKLKTLLQQPPENQEESEEPEDQPPQDQPPRVGVFLNATTELEKAEAKVSGDNEVLELIVGEQEQ